MKSHSIETQRLSSGPRVINVIIPDLEASVVSAWYLAGSRYDTPGKEGIAHFFEHLLAGRTQRFSSKTERLQTLEGCGIYANAYTTKEAAYYYHIQPAEKALLSLELLLEGITCPVFSEEDIEHEKEIILEEKKRARNDPSQHIWQLSNKGLWGKTSMGEEFYGSAQSISSMQIKDFSTWSDIKYQPKNTLIVAINFPSTEELVRKANEYYLAPNKGVSETASPTIYEAPIQQIIDNQESDFATIAINQQTVPLSHEKDRADLELISRILGGTWLSYLIEALRLNNNLTYWVDSETEYFSDCGLWRATYSVPAAKIDQSLQLAEQQINRLSEELLSERALASFLNSYEAYIQRNYPDPYELLWFYGYQGLLMPTDISSLDSFTKAVLSTNPQSLQQTAIRYFPPARRSVAIIK